MGGAAPVLSAVALCPVALLQSPLLLGTMGDPRRVLGCLALLTLLGLSKLWRSFIRATVCVYVCCFSSERLQNGSLLHPVARRLEGCSSSEKFPQSWEKAFPNTLLIVTRSPLSFEQAGTGAL